MNTKKSVKAQKNEKKVVKKVIFSECFQNCPLISHRKQWKPMDGHR